MINPSASRPLFPALFHRHNQSSPPPSTVTRTKKVAQMSHLKPSPARAVTKARKAGVQHRTPDATVNTARKAGVQHRTPDGATGTGKRLIWAQVNRATRLMSS
jgi:hypothetical protein